METEIVLKSWYDNDGINFQNKYDELLVQKDLQIVENAALKVTSALHQFNFFHVFHLVGTKSESFRRYCSSTSTSSSNQ